jgi:ankyrin repeat protein
MVPESRRRRYDATARNRDAGSPELRQNGRAAMLPPPVRLVALCSNVLVLLLAGATPGYAQVAPSMTERAGYAGLFASASRGDAAEIARLSAAGADLRARDGNARTPLHVAAFAAQRDAMRALVLAGADPNALDGDRYDIVTIAAVANDLPTLQTALAIGGSAKNVTSRYDGTALIAAAHLGHVEVVRELIRAGAPVDHVNNLGWTALIESIVLGDGGPRHTATLAALVAAGANVNLADRDGATPLGLATRRGYREMIGRLERAGAR